MPVGKPDADGNVVMGSRHTRAAGGLGPVGPWDCPACGLKNEARAVEKGCLHCGSGDPTKSRAADPTVDPARPPQVQQRVTRPVAAPLRPVDVPVQTERATTRTIYRLIEYVITDAAAGREVLRRSLVGTMTFPWGQLTGAIIDSLDGQQEDRLRMARMQPGVWLGNSVVSDQPAPVAPRARRQNEMERKVVLSLQEEADITAHFARKLPMETPDTGPAFTSEQARFARALYDLAESITRGSGYAFVHTLALALSNVALELEGNMEPEKFMPSAECLQLANALIQLIPADWDPAEATHGES